MRLDELPIGVCANITGFVVPDRDNERAEHVIAKLREVGFAEGDEVELLHKGLIFGTPLSFRLNRTIIALRRKEAALIEITTLEEATTS